MDKVMTLMAMLMSGAHAGDARMQPFLLYSDFLSHHAIPAQFSCHGQPLSIRWRNAPKGTKSLALVMLDPDAPKKPFLHWVVYNIPANVNQLRDQKKWAKGIRFGLNSLGHARYFGPCPPQGEQHRYQINLYALDTNLNLPAGQDVEQLMHAMRGHVLTTARLPGVYPK